MQGFNRYIPPDFDPQKTATLNSYQGKKHALGKRAKDIDKGILVVRFELPFNIWCGTCNAHIGAGVRYNAQKQKVGNYYSTPIFGFRCKCHLCSGWFELRTDPKNAAYVVHEGARRKDEDWDPEENGGFAVHDTEAASASEPPADPFAHIEKTIDQQTWAKRNTSRISELSHASDRLSSDPYVVSSALRRKFREEKKIALEKQNRDDGLREKFGLHQDVDLGGDDVELSREQWEAGRERRGLPVDDPQDGTSASVRAVAGTPAESSAFPTRRRTEKVEATVNLAKAIRKTTAKKYDPFDDALDSLFSSKPTPKPKAKPKDKETAPTPLPKQVEPVRPASSVGLARGLLAGYASD